MYSFLAVRGPRCSVRALSSCSEPRLLSCRRDRLRACGLSGCGSQAPEPGLGSCRAAAELFYSIWALPRPGIELLSPALAGRFFTTEPPASETSKPNIFFFFLTLPLLRGMQDLISPTRNQTRDLFMVLTTRPQGKSG